MPKEQDEASRLCQLQPRDPELREAHYEDEVNDVPFEEQPDRVGLVLHQADPFVELPGHEGHVEPEGIEALCRRIEDRKGYHWVACGLLSSWLVLGSLWEGVRGWPSVGQRSIGCSFWCWRSSASGIRGRGGGERPRDPFWCCIHSITVEGSKIVLCQSHTVVVVAVLVSSRRPISVKMVRERVATRQINWVEEYRPFVLGHHIASRERFEPDSLQARYSVEDAVLCGRVQKSWMATSPATSTQGRAVDAPLKKKNDLFRFGKAGCWEQGCTCTVLYSGPLTCPCFETTLPPQ